MTLQFRRLFTAGAVAVMLVVSTGAQAAGDGDEAIKYRQLVMGSLGSHISAIVAILKGKVPHSDHILSHARSMQGAAAMLDDIFPPDSDFGLTRAKPEIWQKPEIFKGAVKAFQESTASLVQAAETGDKSAIGAAVSAVGKSCGGCHKPFRAPKE